MVPSAANSIIDRNTEQLQKRLFTSQKDRGERIDLVTYATGKAEAISIADSVHAMVKQRSVAPSEIAVLYRTNQQSRLIEQELNSRGIPLTVYLTAANVHDSTVFEELLGSIEPIKRPGPGRPRVRPCKPHADKAYDCRRCRAYRRRRGILSRIARKGIESSAKLGHHRWVVERTIAWLNRCRRLTIRSERNADLHLAFLDLGCALIAFNFLQKGFC